MDFPRFPYVSRRVLGGGPKTSPATAVLGCSSERSPRQRGLYFRQAIMSFCAALLRFAAGDGRARGPGMCRQPARLPACDALPSQPHFKGEKAAWKGTSNTSKHAGDATQEPQHKHQLVGRKSTRTSTAPGAGAGGDAPRCSNIRFSPISAQKPTIQVQTQALLNTKLTGSLVWGKLVPRASTEREIWAGTMGRRQETPPPVTNRISAATPINCSERLRQREPHPCQTRRCQGNVY